jgi:hypothetical protein
MALPAIGVARSNGSRGQNTMLALSSSARSSSQLLEIVICWKSC